MNAYFLLSKTERLALQLALVSVRTGAQATVEGAIRAMVFLHRISATSALLMIESAYDQIAAQNVNWSNS